MRRMLNKTKGNAMKNSKPHRVYKTISTASIDLLGEFASYEDACRFAHQQARAGIGRIEMYGPGYHSHYSPWYTPYGDN